MFATPLSGYAPQATVVKEVGDQAADLRLRRCARLREPRRRDSARQRHVRSDVCEEVVPHAWVRRRVEIGQQLG